MSIAEFIAKRLAVACLCCVFSCATEFKEVDPGRMRAVESRQRRIHGWRFGYGGMMTTTATGGAPAMTGASGSGGKGVAGMGAGGSSSSSGGPAARRWSRPMPARRSSTRRCRTNRSSVRDAILPPGDSERHDHGRRHDARVHPARAGELHRARRRFRSSPTGIRS